jgi:hypothetical protein
LVVAFRKTQAPKRQQYMLNTIPSALMREAGRRKPAKCLSSSTYTPSETHDRSPNLFIIQAMLVTSAALSWAFLSLLPLTAALDTLLPNHAKPVLAVVPDNFTIMTPRETKSLFSPQSFGFGSHAGLGRFTKKQQICDIGFGLCPNDVRACCQLGGDCCGSGFCCDAGNFCYASGCCPSNKYGCDRKVSFWRELQSTCRVLTLVDRDAVTRARSVA